LSKEVVFMRVPLFLWTVLAVLVSAGLAPAETWTLEVYSNKAKADQFVVHLFKQLLEREVTPANDGGYSKSLTSGKLTMREMITMMVKGDEYRDRFLSGQAPRDAVKRLIQKIFERDPKDEEIDVNTQVFLKHGTRELIVGLVNTAELQKKYPSPPPPPRHRESK
jgi:hypothetical protein